MSLIAGYGQPDRLASAAPGVRALCFGVCPSLLVAGLDRRVLHVATLAADRAQAGPGHGLATLPRRFTGEFRTLDEPYETPRYTRPIGRADCTGCEAGTADVEDVTPRDIPPH